MSRPRLFCEFPAGLASVSLRLQGGATMRPPISRMGNKAGYSKIILGVLGLHSGQGAGAYWWAEADQDVAALLRIYPDPVALLEVARIIRGWSDEEPRALWERLRAERRERGSRSDPGGVAEYAFLHQGSFQHKGPEAGIGRPEGIPDGMDGHGAARPVASILGDAFPRLADRGWPPVRVSPSIPTAAEVSAAIGTPGDLEGCIVYSDPPYINTTGYGHNLSRAAVVAMARDFSAMGATVAISEQTPISELDGWESVEISDGRVGAKRTFSAQKREYLTMNRTPGFKIPTQYNLLGASE